MKVYKTEAKKRNPGLVLVWINHALNERDHSNLTSLSENSDLMFIFPKELGKEIDFSKLSNLYGACYYGITEKPETLGYWEALDYLTEFESYSSISVLYGKHISDDDIKNLNRLQISQLEKSLFSSRNLTWKEKKEIYTIPKKIYEILGGFRLNLHGKRTDLGKYSRKTSEDLIFFLRPTGIREMKKIITPKILHSFSESDFGTFISSVIPEETHLNLKVGNARI